MQTFNFDNDYQVAVIGETSTFTQTWRYNTKFNERKNEKNGAPLFWVELTAKRYEDVMIFCVFIFLFKTNGAVREQLDENDFRH